MINGLKWLQKGLQGDLETYHPSPIGKPGTWLIKNLLAYPNILIWLLLLSYLIAVGMFLPYIAFLSFVIISLTCLAAVFDVALQSSNK